MVGYLTRVGISQAQLTAVGVGPSSPLAPNTSEANKALNRRISFVVEAN